jgi:hypothetical protein
VTVNTGSRIEGTGESVWGTERVELEIRREHAEHAAFTRGRGPSSSQGSEAVSRAANVQCRIDDD